MENEIIDGFKCIRPADPMLDSASIYNQLLKRQLVNVNVNGMNILILVLRVDLVLSIKF